MTSRFTQTATKLDGVITIEKFSISDNRGKFTRQYCSKELESVIGNQPIQQINTSITHDKGSVRGMHFQHPPHSEAKLVSCIEGRVFDVVVDIREDSPTRLQHYATELNSTQERSLYIPQGFAHGYQALTDNCVLLYLHFGFYEPASEGGLHPADPALAIEWPLKIDHLSARDQQHPLINSDFKGICL